MRSFEPYGSVRYAGPPGWRRIPPVTRGTLALTAAGYLLTVFTRLTVDLTASPYRIVSALELWRLLTYPLVVFGVVNVLFGLLLFWTFGTELEPQWGSAGYAAFLVVTTIVAGALGVGAAYLLGKPGPLDGGFSGLAGILTSVIFAWMLLGPSLPTNFFGILPMTRKVFALLAVVIVAFGEIEQTHSIVRLVFVLGGLPAAWIWVRRYGRGTVRFSMRPPRFFRRRRFRVVRHDDDYSGPVN